MEHWPIDLVREMECLEYNLSANTQAVFQVFLYYLRMYSVHMILRHQATSKTPDL